jgi:transcriptional regulator with XRE-family HTH domain/molybdate-binding protein
VDRIRALRAAKGWSQQDLADRAGVTRQLVGAVEAGRNVPSVTAALALARVLGVPVEALFDEAQVAPTSVTGAPLAPGTPVVAARVGGRLVAVDVAHGLEDAERWAVPDATVTTDGLSWLPDGDAADLAVAGCDPVLGTLAGLVARTSPHRMVAVHASTGRSLDALAAGTVHGVLVHARDGDLPAPPVPVRRWHVARWEVGLASRGPGGPPPLAALAERRATVVQREAGAGSQRALERALALVGNGVRLPGPVAEGHVDVARRVSQGAGRVGVTMAAAARAFGLGFAPLEDHVVELWLDERWAGLPAAVALLELLGGESVTRRVGLFGGYDLVGSGTERRAG